jgi:molybdopterin converting factor small subunit
MRVTVMFLGPLGSAIDRDTVEFDLPDNATYGDLLDNIGREYASQFPKGMWDFETNQFKRGVLTVGTGRDLDDRTTQLKENENIKFVPMLVGG